MIDRIADDGRTDAFQRYPYLMRFTGIGATQKGTQPGLERGAVELGSGKIVALTGQTPTAATAAYHAAFDAALFFARFVIAQRQIEFADLLLGKGPGQLGSDCGREREHHQPRSHSVEPMHRPDRLPQRLCQQHRETCSLIILVHADAGCFVDHDKAGVAFDDAEGRRGVRSTHQFMTCLTKGTVILRWALSEATSSLSSVTSRCAMLRLPWCIR